MPHWDTRSKYAKAGKVSLLTKRTKRMPHRCIKCMARATLSRLWWDYYKPPKCKKCGYYRLTPCFDRLPGRRGRINCYCQGYPWIMSRGPHRKGSRFCERNPNYEQIMQEIAKEKEREI